MNSPDASSTTAFLEPDDDLLSGSSTATLSFPSSTIIRLVHLDFPFQTAENLILWKN